jgi:hypothetical protein
VALAGDRPPRGDEAAVLLLEGLHDNAALETKSTPPVVRTKSSTTNRSIASGSRAFRTAAQNPSTTLTDIQPAHN